jgi:CheY-like chemotaxis protein
MLRAVRLDPRPSVGPARHPGRCRLTPNGRGPVRPLVGLDEVPRARWHQSPSHGGSGAEEQVDVLVIDDEDNVRSSICEILGTVGISTGQAADGMDALQRLSGTQVGALVLDVRMPRLDGLGLLDRLADPPPTVLVSAYSIDEEVRDRLGGKVFAYLQKPFRPDELLTAVSSALGRPPL